MKIGKIAQNGVNSGRRSVKTSPRRSATRPQWGFGCASDRRAPNRAANGGRAASRVRPSASSRPGKLQPLSFQLSVRPIDDASRCGGPVRTRCRQHGVTGNSSSPQTEGIDSAGTAEQRVVDGRPSVTVTATWSELPCVEIAHSVSSFPSILSDGKFTLEPSGPCGCRTAFFCAPARPGFAVGTF